MLLADCQRLRDLAQHSVGLKERLEQANLFIKRQEQIQAALDRLQPAVVAFRVLRDRNLITLELSQQTESFLATLQQINTQFCAQPTWILETKNFNPKPFQAQVDSLANSLEQNLSKAWATYCDQRMPSSNTEMLTVLGRIATLKHTVQTIQILSDVIKKVAYPKSTEEFEQIEKKLTQLSESWNSLKSDDMPNMVQRFLRAAATEGAPVTLLTEEVKDWLIQRGLIDSFQIRSIS
ncbi:MAG TPA: hypothetical protein V6D10_10340 [Trichocoleus sp.]|jgi:hypothetical protein